jgi:hypothetical protein
MSGANLSMNKNLTIGVLLIVATVAYFLVPSLMRSGDAPAAAPAFTVPAAPSAVYDAILPEIRERIARDTKIVRIDSGNGAIVMRFSAYLEDHSVRLVEIALAPQAPTATSVTIDSRRFSFLPGRSRDAQDASLETSLAALVKRHVEPGAPVR